MVEDRISYSPLQTRLLVLMTPAYSYCTVQYKQTHHFNMLILRAVFVHMMADFYIERQGDRAGLTGGSRQFAVTGLGYIHM